MQVQKEIVDFHLVVDMQVDPGEHVIIEVHAEWHLVVPVVRH